MYSGRTEMRAASLRRLEDAEVLQRAGRWLGARYLFGYWVEMTIKFRLMEVYDVSTLETLHPILVKRFKLKDGPHDPKIYRTHSLQWITAFHPGFERLRSASNPKNSKELEVVRCLNLLVGSWNSELRYSADEGDQHEAERFEAAARIVVTFTNHS